MGNIIRIKHISELYSPRPPPITLMGVFAHPDDESLLMGGAFPLAHAEGIRTTLVTITGGELGGKFSGVYGKKLAATRSRELTRAAAILRIDRLTHMNVPDRGVRSNKRYVRDMLIDIMGKHKPQIIITHDPIDPNGHPDHKAVSQAVYDAVANVHSKWAHVLLSVTLTPNARQKTYVLDIERYNKIKIRACSAHVSQGLFQHLSLPVGVYYGLNHFEYFVPYENKTTIDGKRHHSNKK